MSELNPRIFVACQSAYDAGYVFGLWLDAAQPLDEIQDKVNAMLAESSFSNAGKYLISDSMDFGTIQVKQFSLEEVIDIAKFIHEEGPLAAAILECHHCDAEDGQAILEDNYLGAFDSKLEFGTQLFDDCYTAPEFVDRYIDYNKFTSDLFYSGDYYSLSIEGDSKLHIFSSH